MRPPPLRAESCNFSPRPVGLVVGEVRDMAQNGPETDALLDLAGRGDDHARWRLLDRHRARLLRMIAVRMDGRLAARLDPSDVVQEALADAARALPDYLSRRP